MTKSSVPRAFMLCCLLFVGAFLQGCVPIATGVIAYDNAISFQEHSAYTEYLFSQQAKNKSLPQGGEPIQPILPESIWRKDYRLRLQYAEYYTRQTGIKGEV